MYEWPDILHITIVLSLIKIAACIYSYWSLTDILIYISGTRMSHKSDGCGQCHLQDSCTKANDVTCSCDWHQMNEAFENQRCELDVRTKAKTPSGFPDQRVSNMP